MVRRPANHQFGADIITLGGHQQLERTSIWADTARGTSSSLCLDNIRGGRHVNSSSHQTGDTTSICSSDTELEESFRAVFCGKPESWEDKPKCRNLPNLEVATGDPVRTAIEKHCKSRRIQTESPQVAETTIHDK